MNIIDCHVHLFIQDWFSQQTFQSLSVLNRNLAECSIIISNATKFYDYLKSEGVDTAFIIMSWHDLFSGGGEDGNKYVADFCRDICKLIPICYIEPNCVNDAPLMLEKFVKDHGMKGLKLHPPSGFYPNDSKLYPLYSKAAELNIPVFFHIGSSILPGMRFKYSRPGFLDDVALDFPELTIVMIHSGRGCDYQEAFLMSRLHKNIILDITGLPPKKLLNYFPELKSLQNKIIFGSDWPAISSSIAQNILDIKSLPLDDKVIENILKNNAEKLIDKHKMI